MSHINTFERFKRKITKIFACVLFFMKFSCIIFAKGY